MAAACLRRCGNLQKKARKAAKADRKNRVAEKKGAREKEKAERDKRRAADDARVAELRAKTPPKELVCLHYATVCACMLACLYQRLSPCSVRLVTWCCRAHLCCAQLKQRDECNERAKVSACVLPPALLLWLETDCSSCIHAGVGGRAQAH